MRKAVDTGLPPASVPSEHAISSDGYFYTAQIPLKTDGTVETGSAAAQTLLTLENLKRAVEAAGGTLNDINQVLVYVSSPSVFADMNEVYSKFFSKPYPNRATVIVGLLVPGMVIEIVAQGRISRP